MNEHQDHNPPLDLSVAGIFRECKDFATRQPVAAVAAVVTAAVLLKLVPRRWLVTTASVVGAALVRPAILSLAVTKALELCTEKPPATPAS